MSAQAAASEWVLTHQIVVNQLLRLGAQFLGGRRAEANGPCAFALVAVHYIGSALHDPPTATQETHTQRAHVACNDTQCIHCTGPASQPASRCHRGCRSSSVVVVVVNNPILQRIKTMFGVFMRELLCVSMYVLCVREYVAVGVA